ncbi:AraC family transcriptional regulator [Chitinibacter fontanus]|uniref:AraC family transcriptional regulator n=1 Tax=Chitinibacter fontanus TaxID=1737446 RepID=A0A7D5VAV1_9NEIS|nr:AraC family transcriptional regulator [Chitinibacter fontanus]QLI82491.1 AraC family transcriptional regulator [Chitinibacter fontanus]
MSQIQIRQIQQSMIYAKSTQQLRQVSCLQPTLMRIRHGEKHIWLNEQTYIARAGDILIAPAGLQLTLTNQPDVHGYACEVLTIAPGLIEQFRQNHPAAVQTALQQAPRLCEKLSATMALLWDELFNAIANNEPVELIEHRAAGLLLALTLSGFATALLSHRDDTVAQRVQMLIMLEPAREWTVELMAKQLNLGASTLRRQLQQEGQSFREILERIRLNIGLGLIQTSKHAIGQIAQQCGYQSASRFSARFQLQFGIKPLQLRATIN